MAERYHRSLTLDWEYLRQMIIHEKHLTPEAIATAEEDFAYFQEYGCSSGEEY